MMNELRANLCIHDFSPGNFLHIWFHKALSDIIPENLFLSFRENMLREDIYKFNLAM